MSPIHATPLFVIDLNRNVTKNFFFWQKFFKMGDSKKLRFSTTTKSWAIFAKFTAKNAFLVFFTVNWAYIGQPDNHIGWAKSMPFTSINPTYPRTNFRNFGKNCSAFGGGWKSQFFELAILKIFCQKNFFLLHSYLNLVTN